MCSFQDPKYRNFRVGAFVIELSFRIMLSAGFFPARRRFPYSARPLECAASAWCGLNSHPFVDLAPRPPRATALTLPGSKRMPSRCVSSRAASLQLSNVSHVAVPCILASTGDFIVFVRLFVDVSTRLEVCVDLDAALRFVARFSGKSCYQNTPRCFAACGPHATQRRWERPLSLPRRLP